jgi:hypothetical protein
MSRQPTRSCSAARRWPGAKGLGVAVLMGAILSLAPAPAQAVWGLYPQPPKAARPTPPDQSWLLDVPERPGAHSRGKVAVFAFPGDDVYQPVRAAVVRTLRRRHLSVTATLKPVESAVEYREMSYALNLQVYVEGELSGEGARQSALIRLYSGLTGRRIASVRFTGPTEKIVGDVGRTLWTRLGPTITRTCKGVSHPRKLEREPLRIDAGTPIEPGSDIEGT